MAEKLTIQAYWSGRWMNVGEVLFADPGKGLTGAFQFFYGPAYINDADTCRPGIDFIDERSIGVHLPGSFVGHFNERHVAPVLRDMIPQGAARRALVKLWGGKDTGPGMDFRLLKEGCVAPIGNLRIKEAAEAFQARIAGDRSVAFTRKDVDEHSDELIEHAHQLGIAIEGAAGAGGDAPKLLLVEDGAGNFYLEGTLDEAQIARHWLVKFPRGRMLAEDEDILRSEGVFYKTLAGLGVDTIDDAELHEGRTPSLWLPRFDRRVGQDQIERFGVESVYSLMGMIGDGARLHHMDVLGELLRFVDTQNDALLIEYLLRDVINAAIGNTDNHGRNTAVLKRNGAIHLAPAYDLAPMVLDREAIARSTVWGPEYQVQGVVDYMAVIDAFADDSGSVAEALIGRLVAFEGFRELAIGHGLPASVQNSPRIHLDRFGVVAKNLQAQLEAKRN